MAENNLDININTKADKSEVEDLSEAIKNLKEVASDIEIEVKTDDDEVDSTKQQIDDLQSDVEVDVGVDDSEIVEASEDIDGLATAVDGAAESSDSLNQGLNINASPLSDASNMAYELAKGISDADDSTQQLGNDLSLLEAGAMLDIANQLSQYGAAAEGLSQDMNEASISVGQLATNTGVAEPQMVSLINHISNATFPNNEAMAYVSALNQMGVSSDKLGESATNMDRINDATGIGYQKTMQLTQGLQSVGVSADNLPSSFNAIAYAQANVNGGADTLTQVLKRQASTINEYGLNTDQLVLIMQKLSEKGVQGMKMGSELSSVLKETNGDTRALEQSLGLQEGALSNASEATSEYEDKLITLASEEMEHKTVLDQINAMWEDMSLLMSPVLAPLTSFLGLIGQAGSFAVGINGLVTLAQSMRTLELANIANTIATKASAAAQWLLNIAMDANPVMLVVLAIVALIAVLGYLYFNNEQVRQAIDALGQTFIYVGQIIYSATLNFVNWVIASLQNLYNYIMTLGGFLQSNISITGNNIIDTVLGVMIFIATLPYQLEVIFVNMIAKTLGFGDNFVQNMVAAGFNAVNNFKNQISGLSSYLINELNQMLSYVGQWASSLPSKFWEAGVNAVKNFLSALGIASPGIMQRTLLWEISEMGRRTPIEARPLLSNISSMGDDVVNSFGAPALDMNLSNVNNSNIIDRFGNNSAVPGSGDTIINVYGDVDSDARVRQIVEAVRRELSWDNKKAGRSV